jgi:hypothetical protein
MEKPTVVRDKPRGPIPVLCALAILSFTGLQLWPGATRSNPPVVAGGAMEEQLRVPPAVSGLLYRSCGDCHSNQTRWPWYSRVAPISWQVTRDVAEARGIMNFSDWSSGPGSDPDLEKSWLALICSAIQSRQMPPERYLFLHPEARLSADQVATLCNWTRAENIRLSERDQSALNINQAAVAAQRR